MRWAQERELLARVDAIPHGEIRHAHRQAKQALVEQCRPGTPTEALTIGFARRPTAYKRTNLLISDLDKTVGG